MLVFTRCPGDRFRLRFKDGTVYWFKILAVEDREMEVEVGKGGGEAQLDPLACTQFWTTKFPFDKLCCINHNNDQVSMEVTLVEGSHVRLGFVGKAEIVREELLWKD